MSGARRLLFRVVGAGRRVNDVHRYVLGHFLAVIAEWSALIGLLVYAFDRNGARVAGYASIASLAPYLLFSSVTSRLAQRKRPASVRLAGLLVQIIGYGAAALCAMADGPLVITIVGTALAFTGVTSLRPSGAVLLPALVRSSRQLTTANLWVGRIESAGVLVGPLFATGLLHLGGGAMVLAGCSVLCMASAAIAVVDVRKGPPAAASDESMAPPIDHHRTLANRIWSAIVFPTRNIISVARRPGARGVLAAATAQFVMVGAFDIVLVVLAGDYLDLGSSGAGILTTFFGAGAFASIALSGRAVRRSRLAPLILISLAVMSVACAALGTNISLVAAIIALPLLGCSRSILDLMARVLLQRSAPPSQLAGVFGALEACGGIGLIVGSLLAQSLIALSGVRLALLGVGALYAVMTVALIRPLRTADNGADVPVVAMSLLRRLPMFAPLPTIALEAVARSAVEVPVAAGEIVILQDDPGDRFYAVCDGQFDVIRSGELVRTAGRGSSFGEIALLSDVPRTATVTASESGTLLAIERVPFLVAVTGYDSSSQAAWGVDRAIHEAIEANEANGDSTKDTNGDSDTNGDPNR